MKYIKIDASGWRDVLNFYHAILAALGAPSWHGASIDALVDSMVYGGINDLEPPYRLIILNAMSLPERVLAEVELAKAVIEQHCSDVEADVGIELHGLQ